MKIQEVIDRVLTDSTGETRIAPTCAPFVFILPGKNTVWWGF